MYKPLKFRLERKLPNKTLVLNFIQHLNSLVILYSGPEGPEDKLNTSAIIWIKLLWLYAKTLNAFKVYVL